MGTSSIGRSGNSASYILKTDRDAGYLGVQNPITDKEFATGFDEGYEQFKIGCILRQARESAGLTQEEPAFRLKTQKTAISRIENHAEDIKLSTLDRVAKALGKRLEVHIA